MRTTSMVLLAVSVVAGGTGCGAGIGRGAASVRDERSSTVPTRYERWVELERAGRRSDADLVLREAAESADDPWQWEASIQWCEVHGAWGREELCPARTTESAETTASILHFVLQDPVGDGPPSVRTEVHAAIRTAERRVLHCRSEGDRTRAVMAMVFGPNGTVLGARLEDESRRALPVGEVEHCVVDVVRAARIHAFRTESVLSMRWAVAY